MVEAINSERDNTYFIREMLGRAIDVNPLDVLYAL